MFSNNGLTRQNQRRRYVLSSSPGGGGTGAKSDVYDCFIHINSVISSLVASLLAEDDSGSKLWPTRKL